MTLWIRSESVFSRAHTFEAKRVSNLPQTGLRSQGEAEHLVGRGSQEIARFTRGDRRIPVKATS
jgi:hypothetical protein